MKKILSIILCLALVLSLSVMASADGATATLVNNAADLNTTDSYVIVDATGAFAMGAQSGNYRDKVDVTVDGTKVTLAAGLATVTLEDAGDGAYYLKVSDGYLHAVAGSNHLKTTTDKTAEHTKWTVSITTEEGVTSASIVNTTASKNDTLYSLQYNAGSPRFSGYVSTQVAVNLYKVDATGSAPETPVEPEQPTWENTATLVTELTNGAQVILNYKDSVATAEEYTYDNGRGTVKQEIVLADAAVDGTTLSYNDAVVLTVEINDGKVSFKTADGKYLYADGTDVKYVAEAGEHTQFVLETAEGGYYIKCANAVYHDTKNDVDKPQYLEVYGGYLTCYSFNESKADIYTFAFYAPKAEEAPSNPGETEKPGDNEKPDDSNPKDGDMISVVMALAAISAVGAAVVLKKKEF